MNYTQKDIERYFSNVIKTETCWLWIGETNKDDARPNKLNYGRFFLASEKKRILSHRFSYFFHYGKFDLSNHVLHTCDNPLCVNPEHLFIGTNTDNVRDKINKGRANPLKGEKVNTAKLTEEQVVNIKKSLLSGASIYELARKYFVNQWTIHDIKVGKNWKHVMI